MLLNSRILPVLWLNLGRALTISAIVGSLLVLINHGDHLADEPICAHFWLKLGLSYLVPFTVSMTSAVLAVGNAASQQKQNAARQGGDEARRKGDG